MPLQIQIPELTQDEWKILEFHAGQDSVTSEQIAIDITLDQRLVLNALHHLHYEGLVYFIAQSLGTNETVVSKITKRGLDILGKNMSLELYELDSDHSKSC